MPNAKNDSAMKNVNAFILAVSFLTLANQVAGQQFQRTYGSTTDDNGKQIVLCTDNNYAIIGFYGSTGGIYLIKVDSSGNSLWQKTFDPTNGFPWYGNFAFSFQQTQDNGFIIAGNVSNGTGVTNDICLIKTNSTGDTLWTKTYGGPNPGYYRAISYEIIKTSDGGFAIVGNEGESFGGKNVFLIKTDGNGDLQWSKSYGGSNDDEGYSLKQTSDGGYIIAGYTYSFGQGVWDVYLLKVSSAGNLQWTKTYGGNRYDYANHVEITNDGGFILTGVTSGYGTGTIYDNDLFLMKTDSLGNNIWTYTYGEDSEEIGTSIKQTADDGFVATGYTNSFGAGQEDVFLLRTDSIGSVIWSRTYGGASTEQGNDVIEHEGNYIISGETRNFSKGLKDVYLIKVDSLGNGICQQDTAIITKTVLNWTQGTGGTESSGNTIHSSVIIPSNPDTARYNPCVCIPPLADFQSSFLDNSGQFSDYSTWADFWYWDFGNGDTSTTEHPMNSFPNGSFNVCLTVTNACGTNTYCENVFVQVGTNELENYSTKISVTPNPFNDYATVRFDNAKKEKLNLQLLNALGQTVLQFDNLTDNVIQIERNNLPSGLYFILLKNDDHIIGTDKLIIN